MILENQESMNHWFWWIKNLDSYESKILRIYESWNQWFLESLIPWISDSSTSWWIHIRIVDSCDSWFIESWINDSSSMNQDSWESRINDSLNQWFIFDESRFIWICDSWNLRFLESMIHGIMQLAAWQRCCKHRCYAGSSRWVAAVAPAAYLFKGATSR